MRKGAVIVLMLVVGIFAAANRLSGQRGTTTVAGPLASGRAVAHSRVTATETTAFRRLGKARIQKLPIAPTPRSTLARASHPQQPAQAEAETQKGLAVPPKGIEPRAAYRAATLETPSVSTKFDGLNSTQGQADPPDVQVATGPTAVVEMVNTVYAMWNRSTGALLDSGQLDTFFSTSGVNRQGDEVSDPRVLYDTRSGRWFTALFDVTRHESLVGVSDTSDPTGGWGLVAYPFGNGCPDQPRLGLSDNVVVVGVDLFKNCNGGALQGGAVLVFDKPQMLGNGAVDVQQFQGGTALTQITPAISLTPTAPDYLVSIERNKPTMADLYTVTSPSQQTIPVQSIRITRMDVPPNAPQKGSVSRIDTGDDRVQNARFENGVLTFVASDACTPRRVPLACARLAQINTASAQLMWQKELFLAGGRYLFYPVVESDGAGNLLLAFGYSSGTEYPGVGAVTLQPNRSFSSWTIVQKGTSPHKPGRFAPRYGDYFGIGRDPVVPRQVWAGGEYGSRLQQGQGWGTAVFAMSAGNANRPPPPPPDKARPTVKPQATRAKAGHPTKLRFTLRDNSGWAVVNAGVFRGSGQVKKFAPAEVPNGKWFLKWTASSRAATLRFCTSAVDAGGNSSKRACAPVRVT
jgi:hypothetical protein